MTATPAPDDDRLQAVLRIYAENPLDDGEAILFLNGRVCVEIAGLATEWDSVLRRNTAGILRKTARSVVVAIARTGATLQPGDLHLWRDLAASSATATSTCTRSVCCQRRSQGVLRCVHYGRLGT